LNLQPPGPSRSLGRSPTIVVAKDVLTSELLPGSTGSAGRQVLLAWLPLAPKAPCRSLEMTTD